MRVVEQIEQQRPQQLRFAPDGRLLHIALQALLLPGKPVFAAFLHGGRERTGLHPGEGGLTALKRKQVQQRERHALQTFSLGVDRVGCFKLHLARKRPAAQRVGVADDGGQRRFQLMRKAGRKFLLTLRCIRQLPQPAVMHLDHGAGIPEVVRAIRLGMTGVMIDASTLPLEENIAMTKLAAELCSYAGVPVEGELGHVGATKDEVLGNYTDVAEAERFVKETGVSALAVMVGTAHGRYKKAPVLDIQRIRDIREATGKLPLVLHGGSGVPDEQIRMAVEAGIRKVNFATDLCYAFLDQVMVTERTTVALDVFMREPIHAVRDYCIGKIKLLGADKIL